MVRFLFLVAYACLLAGCQQSFGYGPVINSGSYDWTDEVRDARGFPLPGWGTALSPSGGMDGVR